MITDKDNIKIQQLLLATINNSNRSSSNTNRMII